MEHLDFLIQKCFSFLFVLFTEPGLVNSLGKRPVIRGEDHDAGLG